MTTTYLSTGAFNTKHLDELLVEAQEWGVRHIELSAGLKTHRNLSHLSAKSDFHFLVHNYCPPPVRPFVLNLASEDKNTLALSQQHCKTAVELCNELKSPWYSVHAGFAARVKPEHLGKGIPSSNRTDKAQAGVIFEDSVGELCHFASAMGVEILVENNVVEPQNLVHGRNEMLLLATDTEIVDFFSRMKITNLNLLLDVGHANVSCTSLGLDREAYFERVAPFVTGLHLSSNNGYRDSNQTFNKDTWVSNCLKYFEAKYCVIEAYRISKPQYLACLEGIEIGFSS
jgi:sugar phosphate isomerase/epimerase